MVPSLNLPDRLGNFHFFFKADRSVAKETEGIRDVEDLQSAARQLTKTPTL